MDQRRKKRREWGKPPGSGENQYVLSKRDSQDYCGLIVAVGRFPAPGNYERVIAFDQTVEGVQRDLGILGRVREVLPALIRPGLDVFCYILAADKRPEIIRKEKANARCDE